MGCLECEVKSVKCGGRSVECEVRSGECEVEVWSVECHVWRVRCGVWSLECEVTVGGALCKLRNTKLYWEVACARFLVQSSTGWYSVQDLQYKVVL